MLEKWNDRVRRVLGMRVKPRCRLCKRELEKGREGFCRRCTEALVYLRLMMLLHEEIKVSLAE